MQYIAKIWNLSKDEEGPIIKIRQISRYRVNEKNELKWEKHIKMQEFAEIMDGYDLVLIPKLR
jgi:hypothetical protein